MVEQILRFRVTFGDWSDDGHGKTSTTDVEITSTGSKEVTEKRILKNYRANVAKLGFGLPELWPDYEQSIPLDSHLAAVGLKLGAIYYSEKGGALYSDDESKVKVLKLSKLKSESDLSANSFILEDSYRDFDGPYLTSDEKLRFAMFIILAGLKNTSWKEVSTRSLFGSRGSLLVPLAR